MTQYINISHNDMDGAGCNIVLREKFPDMETYHVSYGNIVETLQSIDADISHLTKILFVTDLAFDVKAFNELMRIAESHPDLKIVYIDHHPYEDDVQLAFNELNGFDNVHTKHAIGISATQLCFDMIKSDNTDLKNLVKWINAYDIYLEQEDPNNFKIGSFLNTIFWEVKMSGFKINLINENYKIPKFFKSMYKDTINDKNEYFEKQIKNGLVVFDDDNSILLAFSDKHKSFWQVDYPQYDYLVLPYHTKGNNMSIRFSSTLTDHDAKNIKDDILQYTKQSPWFVSGGGHHHAFGLTLDNAMPKDEQLVLIEGIVDIIEAWNASINMPF